jgi:hypothetical protein
MGMPETKPRVNGSNWYPALRRTPERIRAATIDLKYGGLLRGLKRTPFEELGAEDSMNSSYESLDHLFRGRITPDDVLVDVGSGKGRVINWWLHQGYKNRMVGLEIDDELAAASRRRLRRYENVEIITGNAIDQLPPDGTLFFLFNPFTRPVVDQFKDRLKQIIPLGHRLVVLYENCKYVDLFKEDPEWDVDVFTPPARVTSLTPYAVIERGAGA